ncbi:hypothetical protein BSKO_04827 [Bryopsis sp. KO-2023]|nr:hypothetical protein BSKO_04827 [Bryopsis sp. KO-2023]
MWYADGGACDSGKAEVAATAVAKAIAKVWANAFGKLTCEAQASSCGWDFHHGEHWSIAFAEAIAHASAEAGASTGVSVAGFCFADIRALSKEISEAVLEARADLCGARGTTEDVKNAFVSTAQSRIAVAFARSTAEACSADEELIASSVCSDVPDSDGEGDIFEIGDPCAGGAGTKVCRGPGNEMCCNRGFRRFLCPCQRKGCAHGPWLRKSEFNVQGNRRRTFSDREGTLCICQ